MLIRELKKDDLKSFIEFFSSLDSITNKFYLRFPTDPVDRARLFLEEDSDKIIAIQDSTIIGFAHLTHDSDYPGVPSLGIVVRPSWRSKGIGDNLMEELMKLAKRKEYKGIYLTVHKKNYKALNLYLKYGFKVISEDKLKNSWRMKYVWDVHSVKVRK